MTKPQSGPVRLLVLDVEGVITPPGGSQYPWELEELLAVRRLLEEAVPACVLCTGRQVPYGEAVIQALGLLRPLPEELRARAAAAGVPGLLGWPSILENGACFYDPLAKRVFPHPELTTERIARLRELRAGVLAELALETGAALEAGKEFCISLNPPPREPGSAGRLEPGGFLDQVAAALPAWQADVEIKASASAVDITPKGVSKASAVRLLRGWLDLRSEELLEIGDTPADAEWLAEVEWRAAPANGRGALSDLGFVAPSPAAAGLAEILRRLREREFRGL